MHKHYTEVCASSGLRASSGTTPSRIVATTRLHAPDTFDPEVGIREAFYKADQKHKREMNKALKKWQRGQIQDCIAVGADLFEEVLKEFGYEKGDK